MFGVLMVLAGTLFAEASVTTGKIEVDHHKESLYTMGFLSYLWATLIFVISGFVRDEFLFSMASVPTLLARIVLDVILAQFLLNAVVTADRSTFSFLRITTIPLLLLVDFVLGYTITANHVVGIVVLIVAFLILIHNHGIHKKGAWITIVGAIIAVATSSLYKYNITHFNSVETEQSIVLLVLLLYFFLRARHTAHERPFVMMRKPVFLLQSLASGAASVLTSFAMLFGTASVIMAAKRASAVLWSVLSGNLYFQERHLALKLLGLLLIIVGLIFLAL